MEADTAIDVNNPYGAAAAITDAGNEGFGIFHAAVKGGADSLYVYLRGRSKTSYVGVPYTKNTWMHLGVVNTVDSFTIYVNGKPWITKPGIYFDSTYLYGMLHMGKGFNKYYFKGQLDEVKAFNVALDKNEVLRQTYSIGTQALIPGLIGYWQFNQTDSVWDNTYTHLTDSSHGCTLVATGQLLSTHRPAIAAGKVYPNPTQGLITLSIGNGFSGNQTISVVSMHGSLVRNFSTTFSNGTATIDLHGLAAGTYFIQCQGQRFPVVVSE